MSLDDGPSGPRWTILARGSFLVGRCDDCGFTTAARRARYSAESDLRAHEILCGATDETSPREQVGQIESGGPSGPEHATPVTGRV
jgi:hypothetical protein